jgi:hypothetical protein
MSSFGVGMYAFLAALIEIRRRIGRSGHEESGRGFVERSREQRVTQPFAEVAARSMLVAEHRDPRCHVTA